MPTSSTVTRRRYKVRGTTLSRGPLVETKNFVSHGDLLRIARRNHCIGIHSERILSLCRPEKNYWVFKATVFKSSRCAALLVTATLIPAMSLL